MVYLAALTWQLQFAGDVPAVARAGATPVYRCVAVRQPESERASGKLIGNCLCAHDCAILDLRPHRYLWGSSRPRREVACLKARPAVPQALYYWPILLTMGWGPTMCACAHHTSTTPSPDEPPLWAQPRPQATTLQCIAPTRMAIVAQSASRSLRGGARCGILFRCQRAGAPRRCGWRGSVRSGLTPQRAE